MAEMADQDKQTVLSAAQPGQVIDPGGSLAAGAESVAAPATVPAAQPAASATPPVPVIPSQAPAPAEAKSDGSEAGDIPEDRKQLYRSPLDHEAAQTAASTGDVSWTASEFVAHEKSASWYGGLALVACIVAALIYLLTRDIISTVVIVVCAGAFGVLGGKKPRQLQYHLDSSGVTVGSRHYTYEMFRSFSVVPEGAFSSIVFMPLKRFAPLTTIYYAPEDESKIVNILTNRLPFEERKDAVIDSLMKRVRF